MILSFFWEVPFIDAPWSFTVLQIIVIVLIILTWITAFYGSYYGSLSLVKRAFRMWIIFIIGWAILTIWILFFGNASRLSEHNLLCFRNRCLSTMYILNHHEQHNHMYHDHTEDLIQDKTYDKMDNSMTVITHENLVSHKFYPDNERQKPKDHRCRRKELTTNHKIMSQRDKRQNVDGSDSKVDARLIKRLEMALQSGHREVFVILTNGIPWTSVIVPIMIFVVFLFGLSTLIGCKNELLDSQECLTCARKK